MAQNANRPRPNSRPSSSAPRQRVQGQIGKEPVKRTLRTSEQINRIRERGAQQRDTMGHARDSINTGKPNVQGGGTYRSASSRSGGSYNANRRGTARTPQVVSPGPARSSAPQRRASASQSGQFARTQQRNASQSGQFARASQRNQRPKKQQTPSIPLGNSSIQGVSAKRPSFRKPIAIVLGVALMLLIGFGVDQLATGLRIYQGVSIGDVAVGGMTKEEASEAVSSQYSQRVSENTAVFFNNEDSLNNPKTTDTDGNIEEQISYEESLENRTQWTVNASAVEAVLNVDQLVDEAYELGRSNGGVFARLHSMLAGDTVTLACSFNDTLVDELSGQMTESVGNKRVNYNIKVDDGVASVTSGNDGNEVTSDWLCTKLNETFLGTQETANYVLEPEYMPLQITEEQAQKVADKVNNSIAYGANFTYGDQSWTASKQDLGSWVNTWVKQSGSSYDLVPCFDEQTAKSALLSSLHASIEDEDLAVTFDKAGDGSITVSTSAKGTAPMASDAISSMNDTFFTTSSRTEAPTVEVPSTEIPSSMSFDDALSYGVVTEVSTFTTQYSSGNEARVHNIHTAAGLLDKSICKANNGEWSFNDIAGEADESKGYQAAGAIVGGSYSDAVGGGICQVATTVFNAIYDAGYPVKERHNHSLYISSYPEGRDAAIAYPDLNLVWQDDTTSDVLLTMSYTDSSVTCSLWGVDPQYQVSTETGEWQQGEEYSVTYKYDSSVSSGTEYVETTGANGRSITVVRTVKDKDGNVLHTDEFDSNYAPKNKVIVQGTA